MSKRRERDAEEISSRVISSCTSLEDGKIEILAQGTGQIGTSVFRDGLETIVIGENM